MSKKAFTKLVGFTLALLLTSSAAQAASVTLHWTAPGDDGTTGTAAQYDVRYSSSLITAANWGTATQATGEPAPKIAGTAESFTISNLTSNTTYYFAVKAADEAANWSTMSNVVNVATADETAPAPIADLTVGP